MEVESSGRAVHGKNNLVTALKLMVK